MITIRMNDRGLRQAMGRLQELGRSLKPVLQAAARGVRRVLQGHFKLRDREPNRLGGKRTHFWLDIYKSVQIGEVTDRRARVVIGDARFAQKVFGGTIRPKNVKWLAIPAVPEAHGRRPMVFQSTTGTPLRFVPLSATKAELREVLTTRVASKKTKQGIQFKEAGTTGGRTVYWLRKSVTQTADPNAMPKPTELESAATVEAEKQVALMVQQINQGPSQRS